jgi:hypothetical protein
MGHSRPVTGLLYLTYLIAIHFVHKVALYIYTPAVNRRMET